MKTLSFGHLSRLGLVAVALRLGAVGAAIDWQVGDVFVGVGDGNYSVYSGTGTLVDTVNNGQTGFTTGCRFNNDLSKLYTTSFSANKIVVFDEADPHAVIQTINTTAASPESIVFDSDGNFYVGYADPDWDIKKYNSSGTQIATFNVSVGGGPGQGSEGRGSDWIDLAADQSTMFYTSESRIIYRYDVTGAGTQLANFATLPGTTGTAFALRLFDDRYAPALQGGLLVADRINIKRLDSNGTVMQTYAATLEPNPRWFALSLDPDLTTFWAGESNSGNFYRFNITSGAVKVGPIFAVDRTDTTGLFGLCVQGDQIGRSNPTLPPTSPPPCPPAGCQGDPHFKTWRGQSYDYHGECDLVLLHSKEFASGLGLDVHIRTKIRRDMSYISSAALRIGSDVLEVQSQGVYYFNGFANAELPSELSGFEFSHTQPTDKQHVFEVYLGGRERIKLKTYKDFVSVLIEQGKKDHFGDSVGLMGDFEFGVKLARDGKTVLDDANAFGQEWQVLDTEPTLFQTVRFPQHPQTCNLPSPEAAKALRRRLSEASADQIAAEKACAHWGEGKDDCVFDVLATGDLEMAMIGAY